MVTLATEIGQRLQEARKLAGFNSARQFAFSRNIPATTYAQHESGKRSLSAEAIIEYSKYMNINSYWLLTGKGLLKFSEDNKTTNNQSFDEDLLRLTLSKLLPLAIDNYIKLSVSEIIDFCLDSYIIVSAVSISSAEKEKLIDLSISSLMLGAAQPRKLQKSDNS